MILKNIHVKHSLSEILESTFEFNVNIFLLISYQFLIFFIINFNNFYFENVYF